MVVVPACEVTSKTHPYGFPPAACCCSVVIMGFKSCFLRFLPLLLPLPLPLLVAAPATCFALLMAAFLMLSLPFMMRGGDMCARPGEPASGGGGGGGGAWWSVSMSSSGL